MNESKPFSPFFFFILSLRMSSKSEKVKDKKQGHYGRKGKKNPQKVQAGQKCFYYPVSVLKDRHTFFLYSTWKADAPEVVTNGLPSISPS